MIDEASSKQIGYALLRATLGVNLLIHGLIRLPKLEGFRAWMLSQFAASALPSGLVYAWASVLPWLEAAIGLALLLGLFTLHASILGALIIMALIFGAGMIENWSWAGTQMIYALFLYFVITHITDNHFSLDRLRQQRSLKAHQTITAEHHHVS